MTEARIANQRREIDAQLRESEARIDALQRESEARIAALQRDQQSSDDAVAPVGDVSNTPVMTDTTSGASGVAGWVIMGIGVALAAGGGASVGIGQAERASVESAPYGTVWSSVSAQADTADLLTSIGSAVAAVGVVATTVGLVWALLDDSPASSQAVLRILPTGLSLEGQF